MWIGYNDISEEGNWIWADGSSSEYSNWGLGEPDDNNIEDCGVITASGTWNDISCGLSMPGLCKYDPIVTGDNHYIIMPIPYSYTIQ